MGIRDGLTGASIRSIAQTPDGYLWIGADGGVRRYDGTRVARIEMIPPDTLVGVVAQANGIPLMIPRRGELSCIQAGQLLPCPGGPSGLPIRSVRFSAVDRKARNGALWIGSTGGGLFRVQDGRATRSHQYGDDRFGLINAIHADAHGRLWVGGSRGLFVAPAASSDKSEAFVFHEDRDGAINTPIRSVFEGRKGNLWVVTDDRLFRIRGAETESYRQPDGLDNAFRSEGIEDRDGNVWIGTQSGLLRFREGHFTLFTRRDGLPDDDVSALFEDREGGLWVGTRSGALAQFTDRTVVLRVGPPSLREQSVESVCEDETGSLWFGTWRGLTRWKDGREQTFTRADGLTDDHVFAVLPGQGDEVWVGTDGGLQRWRHGRFETPVTLNRPVRSLSRDRSNALWIGTNSDLWRLRDNKLELIAARDGVDPGQIRGVQEDDLGIVWVTSYNGLHRVDRGRLVPAQSQLGEAGLAERALYRDPDGTLWFGAGSTLVRRRGGRWHLFGAADGLPGDPVFQIDRRTPTDSSGCRPAGRWSGSTSGSSIAWPKESGPAWRSCRSTPRRIGARSPPVARARPGPGGGGTGGSGSRPFAGWRPSIPAGCRSTSWPRRSSSRRRWSTANRWFRIARTTSRPGPATSSSTSRG